MGDLIEGAKPVQIIFFSGTGGAEIIADAFKQELLDRGLKVILDNLDHSSRDKKHSQSNEGMVSAELVILVFPVHAFDAPAPVYDWIQNIHTDKAKVAVISVSGGGEAWPNTGCRNNCCKELEKSGFTVIYDRMMCMPSNWVFNINDHAAVWMLRVIPKKVNQILDDLFAGNIKRTNFRMGFLRSYITKLEKSNAKEFAKGLTIDASCTGCGWCAGHCPVDNIAMKDQKPVFKDRCVMCFRCVYACPSHAIKSRSFQVLKGGYDLNGLEKRMTEIELEPVEKCCKGVFWSAIRNYLLD